MWRCSTIIVMLIFATPALAVEPTLVPVATSAQMSCNQCIKEGLGAKDNGCPQCMPPFLGIKVEDSSCKKWTEDRRAGGKDSERDVSWLYGFVSGYNAYASGTPNKPHATFFYYDEASILDEIDRKCIEYPRASFVRVIEKFLESMQTKSR
jgi:hypothetical protein